MLLTDVNLGLYLTGRTQAEGVREQSAEEGVWEQSAEGVWEQSAEEGVWA